MKYQKGSTRCMHGGQETLEVLMDEEELKKFGVAALHDPEPRHRDREEQRQPELELKPPQRREDSA